MLTFYSKVIYENNTSNVKLYAFRKLDTLLISLRHLRHVEVNA